MPTWKCTVIVSQPEIVAERDVTCALRAVGPFDATEIACALMGTPGVH
jgi:predicted RNA polymerase sigma factor